MSLDYHVFCKTCGKHEFIFDSRQQKMESESKEILASFAMKHSYECSGVEPVSIIDENILYSYLQNGEYDGTK